MVRVSVTLSVDSDSDELAEAAADTVLVNELVDEVATELEVDEVVTPPTVV